MGRRGGEPENYRRAMQHLQSICQTTMFRERELWASGRVTRRVKVGFRVWERVLWVRNDGYGGDQAVMPTPQRHWLPHPIRVGGPDLCYQTVGVQLYWWTIGQVS
jgi:hypothetical protein